MPVLPMTYKWRSGWCRKPSVCRGRRFRRSKLFCCRPSIRLYRIGEKKLRPWHAELWASNRRGSLSFAWASFVLPAHSELSCSSPASMLPSEICGTSSKRTVWNPIIDIFGCRLPLLTDDFGHSWFFFFCLFLAVGGGTNQKKNIFPSSIVQNNHTPTNCCQLSAAVLYFQRNFNLWFLFCLRRMCRSPVEILLPRTQTQILNRLCQRGAAAKFRLEKGIWKIS